MTGGKLVRGVWLPATETHMVEQIERRSKVGDVAGRGTYQKHKLDLAMGFVPPERRRVALDIGAHVGTWSMWLVRLFRRLEAFEPMPSHRDLWAKNVPGPRRAEESIGASRLHAVALGAAAGAATLRAIPYSTGGTHVVGGPAGPDDCVAPVATLDSFAFSEVDFVKIDVEGQELPVVRGAEQTLRTRRPTIVLEQKGWNADHRRDGNKDALDQLLAWGAVQHAECGGDHILGWRS